MFIWKDNNQWQPKMKNDILVTMTKSIWFQRTHTILYNRESGHNLMIFWFVCSILRQAYYESISSLKIAKKWFQLVVYGLFILNVNKIAVTRNKLPAKQNLIFVERLLPSFSIH